MVSLKGVNIGYQEKLLKVEIDAEFSRGEVVVLYGDNGAGKSTLLKSIAGLIPVLEGDVEVSQELKIGWVDSYRPEAAYLSVMDYLSFGLSIRKEAILSALKTFKLEIELNDFISEISDGQFRKLAIIRQVLKSPTILFLDEPTVYLDIQSKNLLIDWIAKNSHNMLIFCSTHDESFGKSIATKQINLTNYQSI